MANRFWVGGTNTWDSTTTSNWSATSGGSSGASVPGSADTAIFDSNSGAATVTTNYAVSITGLTLDTGFSGIVRFGATNTHTFSGTITLTSGTLDTNSQTVVAAVLSSSNTNTRTLTFGASNITLSATSPLAVNTPTGLTVTANTATMTFTATNAGVGGGGSVNYNGTSFVLSNVSAACSIAMGSSTIANLTIAGIGKSGSCSISTSLRITSSLNVGGNSIQGINRLLIQSSTLGTTRTHNLTGATVNITGDVDFQDTSLTGNPTWVNSSNAWVGDAGGNSGITPTNTATQTNTGVTGTWSDPSKWTSRVPLPQDNVSINTGSGTITADMPRLGKSIDFTGFSGTISFSSLANIIYGSLTFSTTMTVSGTQALSFNGRSSFTITSNGKSFTQVLTIAASGGTYSFQDAFTTTGSFTHTLGTINTNNFSVSVSSWTLSSGVTLNLGTSIVSLTSTATASVWNSNAAANVNAANATIRINSTSVNTRTFAGGGKTYGSLTYNLAGSTGGLIITGANTFGTITFSDGNNVRTLTLPSSATTTITSAFNVTGVMAKFMNVVSSTPGTVATISATSGIITVSYTNLTDITATGGAIFNQFVGSRTNSSGWGYDRHTQSARTTSSTRSIATNRIVASTRSMAQ